MGTRVPDALAFLRRPLLVSKRGEHRRRCEDPEIVHIVRGGIRSRGWVQLIGGGNSQLC